jgi:hypothetical protein
MGVKLKCFILGHKPKDYTDSGYDICERCECHEYHDGIEESWNNRRDKWLFTIPAIYYRRTWILRLFYRKVKSKFFTRCYECNKIDTVLGKPKGDHNDCLCF